MTKPIWQLQEPISAIMFDCDGTLSTIEGIDELASYNGVSDLVKSITAEAMGSSGLNPTLYQQRLNLVKPHQDQIIALGHEYFAQRTHDIDIIIQTLTRLNKSIYLISAGVNPAVKIFGELLNIPHDNIFAVDISFDSNGQYLDFDRTSPLVHNTGKREIVSKLKTRHEHMIYVGDGLNDVAVIDLVTRFIGYGGAFYRENIAALCEYYIQTSSLAPLLPLILTQQEYAALLPNEQAIYHKGLSAIQ